MPADSTSKLPKSMEKSVPPFAHNGSVTKAPNPARAVIVPREILLF